MSTRRPVPTIGFRRERKQNGEQHLVAIITENITLPAGSRLVLRRLHDGGQPTAEYVLVCIPAPVLTEQERARARTDRWDGCATRSDPRDPEGEAP